MNKTVLLEQIAESVQKKHPWQIEKHRYLAQFKELPKEFLEEEQAWNVLLEKSAKMKKCQLILNSVKIEVKLTLDELIEWELTLDKWEEAKSHNILPGDIKKILKEKKS